MLNGLEGISSLIVPPLFVTARCVFGFFGGAVLENLIEIDQNTGHAETRSRVAKYGNVARRVARF